MRTETGPRQELLILFIGGRQQGRALLSPWSRFLLTSGRQGGNMKRFRQTIRVMFSDCDPAQIVFYPSYFRWFDRATQQMFTDVGLPWSKFWPERGMAGLPLVNASAKFSGPARMDDEIVLESWIDEWRGRTFIVKHVITKDGRTIVEGQEIRVWATKDAASPEGIKAAAIPDDIKAMFE